MKSKFKYIVVKAVAVLLLLAAMPAWAEWTSWARVDSFHVTDSYPDIMRVHLGTSTTQPNPAACPGADTTGIWIDIELNKAGRSDFELQQMVNNIYMSMATYRNARFDIDPDNCSDAGWRLARGVAVQNP